MEEGKKVDPQGDGRAFRGDRLRKSLYRILKGMGDCFGDVERKDRRVQLVKGRNEERAMRMCKMKRVRQVDGGRRGRRRGSQ